MIQQRQGLWVPEPTWDQKAGVWRWLLDAEQGPRQGSLEQFAAEVRALIEQDLADIRLIVGGEDGNA